MSTKTPKNIPASVRQRIFNYSEKVQRPFHELLQYYAMERFLYRLSKSSHATRFILKGALMLKVWNSTFPRPTMDIDMLGKTSNQEEKIIKQMQDIIFTDVIPDGIIFDSSSIRTGKILEEADYEGIKVIFQGKLDTARIKMQIDIGFGDIVYPQPEMAALPTLLDFPAPKILCYSRESVVAEKFDAVVARGMSNSRMKDFYDIWILSRQYAFDGHKLVEALRLTFRQRGTELSDKIVAFSQEFIEAKQTQWITFRNKLEQDHIPASFIDIIKSVDSFLKPVAIAIISGSLPPTTWDPSGRWI